MVAYHHIDCIFVYDMRAVGRRDDQHVSKAPFTVIVSPETASATEINVFIFSARMHEEVSANHSAGIGMAWSTSCAGVVDVVLFLHVSVN